MFSTDQRHNTTRLCPVHSLLRDGKKGQDCHVLVDKHIEASLHHHSYSNTWFSFFRCVCGSAVNISTEATFTYFLPCHMQAEWYPPLVDGLCTLLVEGAKTFQQFSPYFRYGIGAHLCGLEETYQVVENQVLPSKYTCSTKAAKFYDLAYRTVFK